jgi:hypothetical protein
MRGDAHLRRLLALAVSIGLLACGESPTQPAPTLLGAWDLVGYSDAGTPAMASGTADFQQDGTFVMNGTITFPGDPPDLIASSGTFELHGDQVDLLTPSGRGTWTLRFIGDEVSLTLEGSVSPTAITLRRPQ